MIKALAGHENYIKYITLEINKMKEIVYQENVYELDEKSKNKDENKYNIDNANERVTNKSKVLKEFNQLRESIISQIIVEMSDRFRDHIKREINEIKISIIKEANLNDNSKK